MFNSGHSDSFTRDNLPGMADWPALLFDLPELQYPERLNAAQELLEKAPKDNVAVRWGENTWTYEELTDKANQIAAALTNNLGLEPGNRVLLRGHNTPKMIAAWYGILLAGGVVVATMPLLRAPELITIIDKAEIDLALADNALMGEMKGAQKGTLRRIRTVSFGDPEAELEALMANQSGTFSAAITAQDDVALLAFTSGTTGNPKACMHFHRDVLAMADSYAKHILEPKETDVFCGSPPIAFTFGLGAVVVFPARVGASVALPPAPTPDALFKTIEKHRVTMLFTAPTAYRALLDHSEGRDLTCLRCCVSAGETLPASTWKAWKAQTGLSLMDGIGATEMIHIFIAAKREEVRPGFTGKAVPGYQACLLDENDTILTPPAEGRLAVKGPTGCRYMADERQKNYVVNGWNVTGDTYRQDKDGYFEFVARSDDMIVSSGYNIGGPEVETALLTHDAVKECAVIGVPNDARGQIVKAYVVTDSAVSDDLIKNLQDHVKATIAPYKYPREIAFVEELPKTQTGKLQRFKLRQA